MHLKGAIFCPLWQTVLSISLVLRWLEGEGQLEARNKLHFHINILKAASG